MPPVILPAEVQPIGTHFMTMANGSAARIPVFSGKAEVMGLDGRYEVNMLLGTTEFLVGRRFTDHFRVTFDHGREVVVEP